MGAGNGQVLKWNGSAWAPGTDNTGGTNADGDAWGVSDEDQTSAISRSGKVTVNNTLNAQHYSTDLVTLSSSAGSCTWDLSSGNIAYLLLGENCEMQIINNNNVGTYILIVEQNNNNGNSLTFPTHLNPPIRTPAEFPNFSTGLYSVDILTFVSDGSKLYGIATNDIH